MNKYFSFFMAASATVALASCQSSEAGSITNSKAKVDISSNADTSKAPGELKLGKKRIFLSFKTNSKWKTTYYLSNGQKKTETQVDPGSEAFLIRQHAGALFVSSPDVGRGIAFVNGKSVKSTGVIAGKGSSKCVKIGYEDGYKMQSCSMYRYNNGLLEVRQETKYPPEDGKGTVDLKLKFDGKNCSLIGYTNNIHYKNQYDPMMYGTYPNLERQDAYVATTSVSGTCSLR